MDYKNHLKTGAMAGVVFIAGIYSEKNIEPQEIVMYASGIFVGSALPDIDHPRSYMAKKLSFVGWIVSRVFKHRGFTHSILFIVMLNVIRLMLTGFFEMEYEGLFSYTMLGLTVGAATHIFMDLFIGNGVKLLFPFDKKIGVARMKSGSAFESIFLKAVTVLFCFFMIFHYREWFF